METLAILIFGILLALLALGIWQAFLFYNHSKTAFRQTQLNDQKYYELKSQIQFVTTVFPIILSILLYAGYTQLNALPEKIKADVNEKINPQLDSLRKKTQELLLAQENTIEKYGFLDSVYRRLSGRGVSISQSLGNSTSALLFLEQKLNNFEQKADKFFTKDIVQQPIYVVTENLYYDMKGQTFQPKKFSELKTVSGKPLPQFKKAPQIISFSNFGALIEICGVTTSEFSSIHMMSTEGPECKSDQNGKIKYSILIFEDN